MNRKKMSHSAAALLLSGIFIFGCHPGFIKSHKPEAVKVVDLIVDDAEGGDNDGLIEAGETVSVKLKLRNPGRKALPSSKVRLSLSTSNSMVQVTQATVSVPAIPPGQEVATTEALVFTLSKKFSGSGFAFHLTTPKGTEIPQSTFTAKVQPQYSVVVLDVKINDSPGGINDSTRGNGDLRLSPGEKVKMIITLKNIGANTIPAFGGTLRKSQSGVTITDSSAQFPQILPGDTVIATDPFVFMLEDTVRTSSIAFLLEAPEISFSVIIAITPPGSRALMSAEQEVANFTVPVFQEIYLCVEKCEITRSAAQNYTLSIQVSICNEMRGNAPQKVAVNIPANKVFLCDISPLQITAVRDRIFFGAINRGCGAFPKTCNAPKSQQVFTYTFSTAALSKADSACVRFDSMIYTDASFDAANCTTSLLGALPLKETKDTCSRAPIQNLNAPSRNRNAPTRNRNKE